MGKVIFNPSGDNRYNLPDKGAKDAFIVKLSSENQVLNVKRFGNKTDEEITDLLFIPDTKEYRLFMPTNTALFTILLILLYPEQLRSR